ncbi:MAG: peptide chain release factor 1 [Clostridiales bacterium]|nr:peptide chain release factor 1 [Clostridiales bacterium]
MAIDIEKARSIVAEYDELTASLLDPAVIADTSRYTKLTKDLSDLASKAETVRAWEEALREKDESLELLASGDEDIKELASEQLARAKTDIERYEKEIVLMLTPKDPRDERNVILEIRAGTGGEEAALFAATLLKMYKGYAARYGYEVVMLDSSPTELGGFKELTCEIRGRGAYSRFKFESGVHRVQRVPVTESGGRIHTSAATVAVLPQAESTDVKINPEDIRIDRFRASGAGGQHINRTDSAIRITHFPSGIVVQCQDQRSQIQNKEKAMEVLMSRLWEEALKGKKDEEDQNRRAQVGSGDRSERIRTYNYHQGRVTDHRVGLVLYRLDEILNGDLDEIVDALTVADARCSEENGQ